jgi:hypothetical protein
MLKRDITYEDYNGETVTETFYFNLTRTEIIDLELNAEGGLEARIKKIIGLNDAKALISEFKKIVLMAYGVKSEDGKRFIKNEQVREDFSQTAAYDALFMELATNEGSAAAFITGVVPKDMAKEIEKMEPHQLPLMPPTPPTT